MPETLIDTHPLIHLHLEESGQAGKIVIRGQFARSDRATENKRLYREGLWRREFGRLSEAISNRRMFGELDHPADGRTKLARVSHIITRLDIKGNEVIGEAEILDTPNGRIMKALAEAKAQVGVSSRGFGSTKVLPDGTMEVQEDFRLDTFDFVADPATKTAYPKVFSEERERMFEGDEMTLEDLKRNYPGLLKELTESMTAGGAQSISRAITETEERTTERLTEQFGVQLRRMVETIEADVAASVRSELMSDPSVAGAKQVVEQIVGLVKSYGIDPQAREEIAQKDEEIAGLKAKLADRELEAQKLRAESDERLKLASEAAFALCLERLIGSDPARETIETLIGDVTTFASKEDIEKKVAAVRAELTKSGVYKDTAKTESEQSEKVKELEGQVEDLRRQVESLETAKKAALVRVAQAEANTGKALKVAEDMEIQLYVEQKLNDLGQKGQDRDSLRSLCESAADQSDVDRIFKKYTPQRRLDEDEGDKIRARVGRGKVRSLTEDTHGGPNGKSRGGTKSPLTEIGLDDGTYKRLAGGGRK